MNHNRQQRDDPNISCYLSKPQYLRSKPLVCDHLISNSLSFSLSTREELEGIVERRQRGECSCVNRCLYHHGDQCKSGQNQSKFPNTRISEPFSQKVDESGDDNPSDYELHQSSHEIA